MADYKLRLIWRRPIEDSDARFENYIYETDLITLPDNANAMRFVDKVKDNRDGWMPELIGGEWVKGEAACQKT